MSTAWAIHEGDCIDVMRTLAPESIDAVITSPPYAMQRKATYGGIPEADYPAWTVAWMAEVRRVLKPDGNVVINIRPHIRNGQISDYTLRTRLAVREAGWCEVDELIWSKPDSMPTGSRHKPRRSWESLHWFAKHGQPFSDARANGKPGSGKFNSFSGKPTALGGDHSIMRAGTKSIEPPAISRCRDIIELAAGGSLSASEKRDLMHPAVYPWQLAQWVARLTCPAGGTILDPFNGSGSTGVAAIRNGYSYVGIDAVAEYAAMSRARLEQVS